MRACACADAARYNICRANMKKRFSALCVVVFCAAALILCEAARAANGVWTGTNSGLWSDTGNWTGATQPTAGGTVTFNGSTTGAAANMITNNDIITSIGVITVGN